MFNSNKDQIDKLVKEVKELKKEVFGGYINYGYTKKKGLTEKVTKLEKHKHKHYVKIPRKESNPGVERLHEFLDDGYQSFDLYDTRDVVEVVEALLKYLKVDVVTHRAEKENIELVKAKKSKK